MTHSTIFTITYITGPDHNLYHYANSVVLPDGYVLPQFGNPSQRRIQLFIFIVGHVGHNNHHEPGRAAWVNTSHYPILWKVNHEGLKVIKVTKGKQYQRVRLRKITDFNTGYLLKLTHEQIVNYQ